jgi:hypothetical protein
LWNPARGMPEADWVIRQRERRSLAAERGSGKAKQLPSGLCPEQPARVPRLCGPARGMPDADQAIMIRQRERLSPAAERG